jgi:hypothetical protein
MDNLAYSAIARFDLRTVHAAQRLCRPFCFTATPYIDWINDCDILSS